MSDRTDLDALFGFVVQSAEPLLAKHGEFYPFAATMDREGRCAGLTIEMGTEQPSSKEVQATLAAALLDRTKDGSCRAAAICVNARVTKAERAFNALIAYLEHDSGLALEVGLPYRRDALGRVTFEEIRSAKGTPRFMSHSH